MMDTQRALSAVERLQERLKERGELPTEEKLSLLKTVLQSPLFHQILVMQESGYHHQHQHQGCRLPRSQSLRVEGGHVGVSPGSCTLRHSDSYLSAQRRNDRYGSANHISSSPAIAEDFHSTIQSMAKGRRVLSVDFQKGEGGLGFNVVGLHGESREREPGIFIQDVQPGSTAHSGGLREADQILAVNGEVFDSAVTQQQAFRVLQNAVSMTTLTVARGPAGEISPPRMSRAVSLPKDLSGISTRQIQLIELDNDGSGLGFGIVAAAAGTGTMVRTVLLEGIAGKDGRLHSGDLLLRIGDVDVSTMGTDQVARELRVCGSKVRLLVARETVDNDLMHTVAQQQETREGQCGEEDKSFNVRLTKNKNGLGITIARSAEHLNAGYSGIVVKGIVKGSAADQNGQVHIGDHILAVDGLRLHGCSEERAMEILRSTGQRVDVTLQRRRPQPQSSLAKPGVRPSARPPSKPERPAGKRLSTSCQDLHFQKEQNETRHIRWWSSNIVNTPHQSAFTPGSKLSEEEETELKRKWQSLLGKKYEIMVAQVKKFSECSGLGVSLEARAGRHFICSILPEGPIGQCGLIRPGDQLLEVNGKSVVGETHKEVVGLLKELPMDVRVVCCRLIPPTPEKDNDNDDDVQFSLKELIAEFAGKSEQNCARRSSRGAEDCGKADVPALSHQAMWEDEVQIYQLQKGEAGLGFSILDYQDPVDPKKTVIVIRSLVPGGLAERDGRLLPGDRLMSVNGMDLSHASLGHAVHVLKSTEYGAVRLGVAKPLPENDTQDARGCVTSNCISGRGEELGKTQESSAFKSRMEAGPKAVSRPSGGLERTIIISRGNASLGMAVSALRDGSCMIVRSVVNGGAISSDGRLRVGDAILAINGEETANLTNAQARAMLRRHSLIGPDLSVTYVPATFVDMHLTAIRVAQSKHEGTVDRAAIIQSKEERASVDRSRREQRAPETALKKLGQEPTKVDGGKVNGGPFSAGGKERAESLAQRRLRGAEERKEGEGGLEIARTSLRQPNGERGDEKERDEAKETPQRGNDLDSWSQPRRVTLTRKNGESLGISVVGGRGMGSRLSDGEMRRGIFVKHIAEGSPASRGDTLKPGDRILQVGGVDVCEFTHEEAVEAIRRAGDRVELLVQNPQVSDPACSHGEQHPSQTNHHNQQCEIPSSLPLRLPPANPCTPTPFKLTDNRLLRKPPRPAPPSLRLPSGPVGAATDGTTSKDVLERLSRPPESMQHGEEESASYWSRMSQRYGGLSGELGMLELDCSMHSSGLGVRVTGSRGRVGGRTSVYVAELRPDGAAAVDGRIRVGDELLEINGQVLYGRSHQNAAAIISNAPSQVRIVLNRNKSALEHMAEGAVLQTDGSPVVSPSAVDIGMFEEDQLYALLHQETRPPPNFSSNFTPPANPLRPTCDTEAANQTPPNVQASPTCRSPAADPTHGVVHAPSFLNSLSDPAAAPGFRSSSCSEDSDPLTRPIIPGCISTIDVCKGHSGLGLSIVGGCNTLLGAILIHEVNEGGAAHRDGRLMAGDHILQVNGIDLRMATHEEALSVLRLCPQRVRLRVYREPSSHVHPGSGAGLSEDMWDLFTVEAHLGAGQELGLGIVGKRDDTGIFVSEVTKGGVVALDGRLLPGDQILSINRDDIRAVSQDYARRLIESCRGSVVLEVARYRATPQCCDCQVVPHEKTTRSASSQSPGLPESYNTHKHLSSPQYQTISLERGSTGLGFSIVGGFCSSHGDLPVYIKNVFPKGAAAEDGRLRRGDRLVAVNGQSLEGVTHSEAAEVLGCGGDAVTLTVIPRPDAHTERGEVPQYC